LLPFFTSILVGEDSHNTTTIELSI